MREWGTRKVLAYLAFREAMPLHRTRSLQRIAEPERLHLAAIAHDPGLATAYGWLAGVYHDMRMTARSTRSRESIRQRLQAVIRAAQGARIDASVVADARYQALLDELGFSSSRRCQIFRRRR